MTARIINEEAIGTVVNEIGNNILDKIHFNSYKLGEVVAKELKNQVQERVYDSYEPTEYKRTRELIDSIEISSDIGSPTSSKRRRKKKVTFGSFFAEEHMLHTTKLGQRDSNGKSIYKPDDLVYIPLWVNEGWSWESGVPKGQQRNPKPHFLERTTEELVSNNILETEIKALFI